MIKSKEFRNERIESHKLFGKTKTIWAEDECLKFANKIEKQGCKVINISVNFNPGEFCYTVYYRTEDNSNNG